MTTTQQKQETQNIEKYNYSHFYIKVENILEELNLCIGHMTFRHIKYDNVVTKTIIIQKYKVGEKQPFEISSFKFDNISLNQNIIKF